MLGGDELRKKDLAGQGSGEKVEKYALNILKSHFKRIL